MWTLKFVRPIAQNLNIGSSLSYKKSLKDSNLSSWLNLAFLDENKVIFRHNLSIVSAVIEKIQALFKTLKRIINVSKSNLDLIDIKTK